MIFALVALIVVVIIGLLTIFDILPLSGGITLLVLWTIFVGSYCVFMFVLRQEDAKRRAKGIKLKPKQLESNRESFTLKEGRARRDFSTLACHTQTVGYVNEGSRALYPGDIAEISNIDEKGNRRELAVYSRGLVSGAKYRVGRLSDESYEYLLRLYKYMLETPFSEVSIQATVSTDNQLKIKLPFTVEPQTFKLYDIPTTTFGLVSLQALRVDDLVHLADGKVKHLQSGKIIGSVDYSDVAIGRVVGITKNSVFIQTVTKDAF